MTHRQYFKKINPLIQFPPASYCPANGYIIDPGAPYVAPIDIGTPTAETISLLCMNKAPFNLAVLCTTSTGKYYAEVYDSGGTLVATTAQFNSNVALTYAFPTTTPNQLYVVKIKTVSGNILSFKATTLSGYTPDWYILQAKFNTPNITSLANAFQYIKAIRSVVFNCTLNFLTTTASMFDSAGILNFTFPASLPELTTVTSMFNLSFVSKIVWSTDSTAPKLTNIAGFISSTKNLQSVVMPASLTEANNASGFARYSALKSIVIPTSMPKMTNIAYFFGDCFYLEGDITFPEMPLIATSLSNALNNAYKVRKAVFQGSMPLSTAQFTDTFRIASALEEVEFPRTMGAGVNAGITCFTQCARLTKIKLPDLITTATLNQYGDWGLLLPTIQSVTGAFENTGALFDCTIPSSKLATFNCPKMRCSNLSLGTLASRNLLTSFEVDWANLSVVTSVILYCQLDATELNRIFTALPTVSAKTIYIKGNPGTETCNQAIATAKGWAVNTTT